MRVVVWFWFLPFFNHKMVYFHPPIVLITYPQLWLKLDSTLMCAVREWIFLYIYLSFMKIVIYRWWIMSALNQYKITYMIVYQTKVLYFCHENRRYHWLDHIFTPSILLPLPINKEYFQKKLSIQIFFIRFLSKWQKVWCSCLVHMYYGYIICIHISLLNM